MVAGEPSGDALGAGLIDSLKSSITDVEFFGVGGPKMASAGCDTIYDMDRIGVMGLDGLVGKFMDIVRIRSNLYRMMVMNPPDLFIGIDVPDFNLALESRLRKNNITTVHYVSPTVWAWRGYRIHKIRRAVDHMLTLFPFEAEFYRKNHIPVTCVGHPIADEIQPPDRAAARQKLRLEIPDHGKLVALLPGSRQSEISRLAPIFLQVARIINQSDPAVQFVLPFANKTAARAFSEVAGSIQDLPITLLQEQSRLAMEAADAVVLASGTAALEAALLRRPHVVVYKVGALTWWLVQRLKSVTHYSMPNQLLGEPVVPEFIQGQARPASIANALRRYLDDSGEVEKLDQMFSAMHRQLKLNANLRASRAVIKLLEPLT